MEQNKNNQAGPWTIIRLLDWTRQFFESKGIDDARLEAELLLAHALGIERVQLYVQHERIVEEPQLGAFRELVKQRAQHVPTQYLLGKAWFRHLTLKVTPAVLIPRPETELLVDEALELIAPPKAKPAWKFDRGEFQELRSGGTEARSDNAAWVNPRVPGGREEPPTLRDPGVGQPELIATGAAAGIAEPRVLDVCTGSGCIAIAIATECPKARVVATDVSAEALAVARENVTACGAAERVTLLEGDLFAALGALPEGERRFDLITANPPYVAEEDVAGLMPEVREHEPRVALVAGRGGWDVIDRILAEAPRYLKPGGSLLMEMAYNQGAALRARVAALGGAWELVKVRKDYGGHERVVHLRLRAGK